jgi:hypothetical protein
MYRHIVVFGFGTGGAVFHGIRADFIEQRGSPHEKSWLVRSRSAFTNIEGQSCSGQHHFLGARMMP